MRCVTMMKETRYTKVKHERSHGGDPSGTKLKINFNIKEDVRVCSEGTRQIHGDGQGRQRADSTTIGNKKNSRARTRKQKRKKSWKIPWRSLRLPRSLPFAYAPLPFSVLDSATLSWRRDAPLERVWVGMGAGGRVGCAERGCPLSFDFASRTAAQLPSRLPVNMRAASRFPALSSSSKGEFRVMWKTGSGTTGRGRRVCHGVLLSFLCDGSVNIWLPPAGWSLGRRRAID